jgi:hypothetical protein
MRQVIRFKNPDGITVDPRPPVEVSFVWKREEGWIEQERKDYHDRLAETGRALWRELFLSICSEEQLADWESRIPKFECNCKRFYDEWKADNPPNFPLPPTWKYGLKSAVNAKLGHANISYQAACSIWGWDPLPG